MPETLLAFDFGEKRIGVAVGNDLRRHGEALTTVRADNDDTRFAQIAALIAEWQPQRLVVGIPYHASGSENPMTARCRRFANQLQGRFGLPVELVDERWTSVEAEAQRRGRRQTGLAKRSNKNIDHLAAEAILQRYFDTRNTMPMDCHAS